ncbi:MAG: response regulator transcription factor, partial [Crocinitomicaceae bacterium]
VKRNEVYISPNIQESSLGNIISADFIKDLTASEIKVLNQIAKSKSSQEIADALFISVRTVEKHRSNIIKKLDLAKSGKSLNEFVLLNKEKFES